MLLGKPPTDRYRRLATIAVAAAISLLLVNRSALSDDMGIAANQSPPRVLVHEIPGVQLTAGVSRGGLPTGVNHVVNPTTSKGEYLNRGGLYFPMGEIVRAVRAVRADQPLRLGAYQVN